MTNLLFDAPLNKKLTESEAVIAALIVENITAWLHEQKQPLYVAPHNAISPHLRQRSEVATGCGKPQPFQWSFYVQ